MFGKIFFCSIFWEFGYFYFLFQSPILSISLCIWLFSFSLSYLSSQRGKLFFCNFSLYRDVLPFLFFCVWPTPTKRKNLPTLFVFISIYIYINILPINTIIVVIFSFFFIFDAFFRVFFIGSLLATFKNFEKNNDLILGLKNVLYRHIFAKVGFD